MQSTLGVIDSVWLIQSLDISCHRFRPQYFQSYSTKKILIYMAIAFSAAFWSRVPGSFLSLHEYCAIDVLVVVQK